MIIFFSSYTQLLSSTMKTELYFIIKELLLHITLQ